jgi:methionyl aminopeptidase
MIVTTEVEKKILQEGGKRLAGLLRTLGEMVAPGVTTLQIEDKARELIAEMGDTPATLGYTPSGASRPYPAALCISVNEEIVHGIPNEDVRTFVEGDIVSIDCLLKHKGLITDSCITVGVGVISDDNKRLIEAAKEARGAAVKAAVIGNTVGDIGYATETVAIKYGYTTPHELGGHGVGESVHEDPFVPNYGRPGSGAKLKEGMVLAIEPILIAGKPAIKAMSDGYTYSSDDGSVSAQFEHTVLITKNGPEILTR